MGNTPHKLESRIHKSSIVVVAYLHSIQIAIPADITSLLLKYYTNCTQIHFYSHQTSHDLGILNVKKNQFVRLKSNNSFLKSLFCYIPNISAILNNDFPINKDIHFDGILLIDRDITRRTNINLYLYNTMYSNNINYQFKYAHQVSYIPKKFIFCNKKHGIIYHHGHERCFYQMQLSNIKSPKYFEFKKIYTSNKCSLGSIVNINYLKHINKIFGFSCSAFTSKGSYKIESCLFDLIDNKYQQLSLYNVKPIPGYSFMRQVFAATHSALQCFDEINKFVHILTNSGNIEMFDMNKNKWLSLKSHVPNVGGKLWVDDNNPKILNYIPHTQGNAGVVIKYLDTRTKHATWITNKLQLPLKHVSFF